MSSPQSGRVITDESCATLAIATFTPSFFLNEKQQNKNNKIRGGRDVNIPQQICMFCRW